MSVTDTDVELDVGDTWVFGLSVDEGSTVAVIVTNPSGVTATPTPTVTGGDVEVQVALTEAGRYLAVITVSLDALDQVHAFTALAIEPTGSLPTLEQVRAYLSTNGGTSQEDATIQEALDAETVAQRRQCRIPASYPADLAEALKRRVARNLAARAVPIAQITSFDGGNVANRVPRTDYEVLRLEGPYRRSVVG